MPVTHTLVLVKWMFHKLISVDQSTFLRYLWCHSTKKVSLAKDLSIDIESLQNRLLKVCYVAATSARLPRLLFYAATINSTNEANKAGGTRR